MNNEKHYYEVARIFAKIARQILKKEKDAKLLKSKSGN